MTLEEAHERLRTGTATERRATLRLLAEAADARVTPAVAALLHADDPELVALAEATLWQIWGRAGDPAVDALFAEGLRAMEAQDWLGAVAIFSRVVEARPAFAEGWNKRATARFLATHYATSIADCEQVLRLNQYHFGALSGQGLCHEALGQFREAAPVLPARAPGTPPARGGPAAPRADRNHAGSCQRARVRGRPGWHGTRR